MVDFSLPDDVLAGLAMLRDLGPGRLEELNAAFRNMEGQALTPRQLAAAAERVRIPAKEALSLVRVVLSLYGLRRRRSLPITEVLEGLQAAIVRSGWTDEEISKWQSVGKKVESLLEIAPLATVSKALELGYEYPNLYQSARILTDIRPVFDQTGEVVKASIVSYALEIDYDNTEGNHSISIAIDAKDLDELAHACERAKAKGQAAKALMGKTGTATIIIGEDEDGS